MVSKIEALEGIDAIRKRPGMYIGDCRDGSGLHHMVLEVVANVVDLFLAGTCTRCAVTLYTDGRVAVEDDGPGMPVEREIHGKGFVEIVVTTLHAGATFEGHLKHVHLDPKGVGLVVVSAVSRSFIVEVDRGGARHRQEFRAGRAVGPMTVVGETTRTGTRITFEPDPAIFTPCELDGDRVRDAMREVAFLNPGFVVRFVDERVNLCFPRGTLDFAAYLARRRSVWPEHSISARGQQGGIVVDAAFTFHSFRERGEFRSYANQTHTSAGTHVAGFCAGMFALVQHLPVKRRAPAVTALFERVVGVLSVTHFDPKFDSPTRSVLANADVKPVVRRVVKQALLDFISQDEARARRLVE